MESLRVPLALMSDSQTCMARQMRRCPSAPQRRSPNALQGESCRCFRPQTQGSACEARRKRRRECQGHPGQRPRRIGSSVHSGPLWRWYKWARATWPGSGAPRARCRQTRRVRRVCVDGCPKWRRPSQRRRSAPCCNPGIGLMAWGEGHRSAGGGSADARWPCAGDVRPIACKAAAVWVACAALGSSKLEGTAAASAHFNARMF